MLLAWKEVSSHVVVLRVTHRVYHGQLNRSEIYGMEAPLLLGRISHAGKKKPFWNTPASKQPTYIAKEGNFRQSCNVDPGRHLGQNSRLPRCTSLAERFIAFIDQRFWIYVCVRLTTYYVQARLNPPTFSDEVRT